MALSLNEMSDIRLLMGGDDALLQALKNSAPHEMQEEAERLAAIRMAERGHYSPDWDYRRTKFGIEARRTSGFGGTFGHTHHGALKLHMRQGGQDEFGVEADEEWQIGDLNSKGYYGGEMALLANELLMNNLHLRMTSLRALVVTELCGRLDYCSWKRKLDGFDAATWAVLIGFVEWVIKDHLKIAFPPLALAVFMTKRHILDEWCLCGEKAEPVPVNG